MTRVISLSNAAYKRLKSIRRGKESFSDVILRITENQKPDVSRFIGAWEGDDLSAIEERILDQRKRSKSRVVVPRGVP
jgi:predicted CopG family antitoxin